MFRNESKTKRYSARSWIPATMMLLLSSALSLAQEESALAYRMAVIKDEAYGRVLLSGDYDKGIAKISSYSNKRAKTFAAKNNLCVAYTLTQKFDDAAPACEAALSISERYVRQGNSPLGTYTSRDQALAYSNRGVLRAVTGDFDGARQDFEFATKVSADLETAAGNLARLESRQVKPVSAL
jgi:tetratricopeptide (TPR) repeat protein